jgi:hypothetical protein
MEIDEQMYLRWREKSGAVRDIGILQSKTMNGTNGIEGCPRPLRSGDSDTRVGSNSIWIYSGLEGLRDGFY